ncbi:bifunctional oligoribonuclease/PAP phosphatase NrnA [Stomatohabitans albus]|uniref:DHH family phosphoesterase n=1 Tax=Stomatohabitans albus TaxID=3110766 RepID=UPI00300D0206
MSMTTPTDDAAIDAIVTTLRGAKRVLVTGHVNPDGDAIGSSRALALALRSLGIAADTSWGGDPAIADSSPKELSPTWVRFGGQETVVTYPKAEDYDVVVTCDTASFKRNGTLMPLLEAVPTVVVIDHHNTNDFYGDLHYIDPDQSSACGVVVRVIDALGVDLTPEMAELLLLGLTTDTGRFSYGRSPIYDHQFAARLIEAGANPDVINQVVFMSNPAAFLELTGLMLSRATLNDGIVISWVSQEDVQRIGIALDESEKILDHLRAIDEVCVAIVTREDAPGLWRTSFRGRIGMNVARIAQYFGGGGHTLAAGCTVRAKDYEDAIAQIYAAIEAVGISND